MINRFNILFWSIIILIHTLFASQTLDANASGKQDSLSIPIAQIEIYTLKLANDFISEYQRPPSSFEEFNSYSKSKLSEDSHLDIFYESVSFEETGNGAVIISYIFKSKYVTKLRKKMGQFTIRIKN